MTRKAIKAAPRLTEREWRRVFELRCKFKRHGGTPDRDELRLVERALAEDRDRYRALDREVFEETKPFGATR